MSPIIAAASGPRLAAPGPGAGVRGKRHTGALPSSIENSNLFRAAAPLSTTTMMASTSTPPSPLSASPSVAATAAAASTPSSPSSSSSVETLGLASPEVEAAIAAALDNCLVDTDLDIPDARVCVGKVRDTYLLDEGDDGDDDRKSTSSPPQTPLAVLVTTDRLSAFDRRIAAIPFKGQVLNETSAWWMRNTGHIVPNALLATPDPCVSVMKKCRVFPVEFVVRGFMTGSTDTSLWTHYSRGEREYCGNRFPDGMTKNQRLAANIITPTTKAEDHDEPISPSEIVSRGLMTREQWDEAATAALKLFEFGQQRASERGLLLVDTKYEFGLDLSDGGDGKGTITLIDEIHTPDSSRYWIRDSYEQRLAEGKEPESIDKEFIRLWFRDICDPYKDETLPEAPRELRSELSRRYVRLFEKIIGETFRPVDSQVPARERMRCNVKRCLEEIQKK